MNYNKASHHTTHSIQMNAAPRNFQVPILDVIKNHPGANVADAYRSFVRYALNHKLDPDTSLNLALIDRSTVFFPPALSAQVQEVAQKCDLTFQVCIAGLAQAGADHIEGINAVARQEPTPDVPFKARPDQARFFKNISAGIGACKIVVAEASTGVGKGRALMAAAVEAAQNRKTPVIVAAPTIVIVNQLWGELQTLRSEGYGDDVSATIMPGAAEFADDVKLREWFEVPGHQHSDPQVFAWLSQGAPHGADDALGQVAQEQGITLAWMMSDLLELANNMPTQDFVLRTDSSDKTPNSQSRQLLGAIRMAANRRVLIKKKDVVVHAGADIILCTHAMLCIGQKTRWAALPKPSVLIVDEAHALEETISRINSHQISLFAVRYKIANFCKTQKAKKGTVARKTLEAARDLMKACQAMSEVDTREQLQAGTQDYEAVQRGLETLSQMVGSRSFASAPEIHKDMHTLLANASSMMQSGKAKTSTYLQFSPDRRYPLISIGADSISQEAGAMWKAAEGGVALASATMYITDVYGNQKCDYVVRNLAIGQSRLMSTLPIESKYIYTIPTLHVPSPDLRVPLSRPDAKDRLERRSLELKWLSNVATQVAKIMAQTKGGTLVLTNSYDQIEGIVKGIKKDHPELVERLVLQKRGAKFNLSINTYRQAHKDGKNPVLISLGPAWTGLNLADEDAKARDDTLLTNLVIACCPIGLNQSPTMHKRIEQTNMNAVAKEALLAFKQGLGRLIRRNLVSDRHIWILDGRLWSDKWLPQFTGPAKRLLAKYKVVEFFN